MLTSKNKKEVSNKKPNFIPHGAGKKERMKKKPKVNKKKEIENIREEL